MKKLYVAAGALLLGTSALALAAETNAVHKNPVGETLAGSVATPTTADHALIDKYADSKWNSAGAVDANLTMAPVSMDKSALGETVSAKLEAGEYAAWSDDAAASKLALAEAKADPAPDAAHAAMSAGTDPVDSGMGGPIESADASLAPRPAAANYPPCDPGPGDDNCIQLYESGVRAQLASWNAPTGGLADGSATTAMGGPYEPVAGHSEASASSAMSSEVAMNGDGLVDPSAGETGDPAFAAAGSQDAALASAEPVVNAEYKGVGGPVVSQSGYPPCEPGAGDDRCIQLYERGVTGAGN